MALLVLVVLCVVACSNAILREDDMAHFMVEELDKTLLFSRCYSMDGMSNNVCHPKWGSAGVSLSRDLYADYEDGYSAMKRMDVNARRVSNVMCKESQPILNEYGCSNWLWAFGQFVDHDLTRTKQGHEDRYIEVPPGDSLPTEYLSFTRTERSDYVNLFMTESREQTNFVTSFIDMSNVYGSSWDMSEALRGRNGLMKTSENNMLPFNFLYQGHDFLENDSPGYPEDYYISGDLRSNEIFPLTTLHTLFMREHNRLAEIILRLNRRRNMGLDDNDIYMAARMFNTWQYHSIIFYEFLPALLGDYSPIPELMEYDKEVNPTISNEFATSAFRFGHSLVPNTLFLEKENGEQIPFTLSQSFFNTSIVNEYGLSPIIRGLSKYMCRHIDPIIVEDLRSSLFRNVHGEASLDLASINIQRGRDHGIPSYKALYLHYSGEESVDFCTITDDFTIQSKLKHLYQNVENIDPWIGLLSEKTERSKQSQFGITLSKIMQESFTKMVKGDRCFSTHWSSSYSKRFKPTTLAEIVYHNTDIEFNSLQPNLFYV